jgi:plastocyanin
MRPRSRYLILVTALGAALTALPALAAEPPTIEAVNVGTYSHYWSPTEAAISTGGSVTLRNSGAIPHGVNWVGGPVKPECSAGVPVGTTAAASGTKWSGTCTFSKAGTYTFYCTVHGPEMTGTITVTTPGAPIATTGSAGSVGETEATLQGTVNPQGKTTTYDFEYGTTTAYGAKTSEEAAGEGSAAKAVSMSLGSLTPGVTYHYRLVAKNSADTTDGADRTFTTASPPAAPSATTSPASVVSETEATLQGVVDPNGRATTYLFEWGTTSQYGQMTSELPAGEDYSAHSELGHLTGLVSGTVYHYRIVAKNALGTTPGVDQMFTTESAPAPPAPSSPLGATVGSSVATTPLPPPLVPTTLAPEPPFGAVALRAGQRGTSVRGSLEVSATGAGGRLEVELLARGASAARAKHSASVLLGRTIRSAVSAGRVSFVVKLDAGARGVLARHRKLALTVRITLTPKHGQAVTIARGVVLRR